MLSTQANNQLVAFREKLIDSNSRSIFVNAHPKKSLNKIDFLSLKKNSFFSNIKSLLNSFLFESQFKISIKLDSNSEQQRKWTNLFRKNEEFKNDFNLDPLGFGYPLLLIKNEKRKQYQLTPIFIWDVFLKESKFSSSSFTIQLKKSESLAINPSLIRYIKTYKNKEKNIDFSELINNNKVDILKAINQILFYLEDELRLDVLFDSPLIPIPEKLDESYVNQNNILINNGVFGLYANSKEPIISDFTALETKNIPCHFTPLKDTNNTYFSGVNLDHSQQRIIRSLQKRNNTIIHGPPGTGKSKTITAVINYALSKGQTCLLVCEKKTAMDVILSNLENQGFSDFVVKITDVKKDRRKVVNKARSIIEFHKKGGKLLFDSNSNLISKNNAETIDKSKSVLATISLITQVKNKMNIPLLENGLSYSDLVLKVKKINLKKDTHLLGLNPKNFKFKLSEFELIQKDLLFLKKHIKEFSNPYQTIYPFLNQILLESEKGSYLREMSMSLYEVHYDSIKKLINQWKVKIETLSAFELRYFNYIESNNEQIKIIFKKFKYYKSTILSTGLFNVNFTKILEGLEPLDQLEKLIEILILLKKGINQFPGFIQFHSYRFKLSHLREKCFIKACEIENFEGIFGQWYLACIIQQNYITHLDFNGFEKGYFDIVDDVKSINQYYLDLSKKNCLKSSVNAISSFEKESRITIEQFFAKRSTSKLKKIPLHLISKDSSKVFQKLFPVIITNPSSCSNLFPMERGLFDFVIFDESSQLRIEDTYPALIRGKISVVSGDIHQLPPSNYFSNQDQFIENNSSQSLIQSKNEVASLLDASIASSFDEHYLDIHYRSLHPDLIQFSNYAFYQKRLIPLPPKTDYCPIEFISVNGIFNDRLNLKEAEAIVNYLADVVSPKESIGVATFSLSQQDKILDLIADRSVWDSDFRVKIIAFKNNGFFVKNIENIQGEERNLILISSTYGPSNNGSFKQLFGPLNTKTRGHRLLNVIITRAIKKMVIFTSIPYSFYQGYEILIKENGAIGKGVFYAFLAYAKAVSEKDFTHQNRVLDVLYNAVSRAPLKEMLQRDLVVDFSIHLKNEIRTKYGKKIKLMNYYSLGGLVYEIMFTFKNDQTLLIDINGKQTKESFEDYLFDVHRCKVALDSGHQYYRLWLSNYYNNPSQEIQNILNSIIVSKEVKQ